MNFNILKVKEGKSVRDPHTASHLAASANIFSPTLTPPNPPHARDRAPSRQNWPLRAQNGPLCDLGD